MTIATDQQVQSFVDNRLRPHAERVRGVALAFSDDISAIADVYNAVSQQFPTWADNRKDGPPHLITANDILGINTFLHDIRDAIVNHPSYPTILNACVQAVAG